MAVGKSGYFDLSIPTYSAGTATVRFWWQENYDVAMNYSTITLTHVGVMTAHSVRNGTYYINADITADGVLVARLSGNQYSVYSVDYQFNPLAVNQTSGAIYHDDATGARTITLTATMTGNLFSNDAGWVAGDGKSVSATVALTTIPRLSEISTANGTLGVAQTLSVTQKSASYTHSIGWVCGSASGTICTKSSALSFNWTPTIDLASQNTTGASVSVVFTITTYSGDTAIGSKTLNVIYAIPDSVKPSVTMTITDANGYADKYGGYVQKRSKLKVVLGVVTAYGSEISVNAVSVEGVTYYGSTIESAIINGSGSVAVTATVTDKRGRVGTATVNINVLSYSPPAILGVTYNRANANGTGNPVGEYAEVTMNASVTALGGNNSATYRLQYKKLSDSAYTDFDMTEYQNVYSLEDAVAIFAASADYSYNIIFTVSDDFSEKFGVAKTEFILQTGKVLMHRRAKGVGMGLGRICEEDDLLDVDWNIRGRKNLDIDGDANIDGALTVGGKSIADVIAECSDPLKFMPIGYIYVSSNPTSPAELFGGTWMRITDRFLLAASDTYTAGSTGGEETHTLTVNESPYHEHSFKDGSHTFLWGDGVGTVNINGTQAVAAAASGNSLYTIQGAWASTNGAGGSQPHNNMPPYLVVYMWKRTA